MAITRNSTFGTDPLTGTSTSSSDVVIGSISASSSATLIVVTVQTSNDVTNAPTIALDWTGGSTPSGASAFTKQEGVNGSSGGSAIFTATLTSGLSSASVTATGFTAHVSCRNSASVDVLDAASTTMGAHNTASGNASNGAISVGTSGLTANSWIYISGAGDEGLSQGSPLTTQTGTTTISGSENANGTTNTALAGICTTGAATVGWTATSNYHYCSYLEILEGAAATVEGSVQDSLVAGDAISAVRYSPAATLFQSAFQANAFTILGGAGSSNPNQLSASESDAEKFGDAQTGSMGGVSLTSSDAQKLGDASDVKFNTRASISDPEFIRFGDAQAHKAESAYTQSDAAKLGDDRAFSLAGVSFSYSDAIALSEAQDHVLGTAAAYTATQTDLEAFGDSQGHSLSVSFTPSDASRLGDAQTASMGGVSFTQSDAQRLGDAQTGSLAGVSFTYSDAQKLGDAQTGTLSGVSLNYSDAQKLGDDQTASMAGVSFTVSDAQRLADAQTATLAGLSYSYSDAQQLGDGQDFLFGVVGAFPETMSDGVVYGDAVTFALAGVSLTQSDAAILGDAVLSAPGMAAVMGDVVAAGDQIAIGIQQAATLQEAFTLADSQAFMVGGGGPISADQSDAAQLGDAWAVARGALTVNQTLHVWNGAAWVYWDGAGWA